MKSDFKCWVTFPTRFRDMDAMNHVNSAVYFTYFEIMRMEYFRSVGLDKLKVPGRIGPAVVAQTCNYRKQVFHPSTIDGAIRSTDVGMKSFSVAYEFYLEGSDTVVADGSTVMVWVDYEREKAIPVPQALRDGISRIEGRTF